VSCAFTIIADRRRREMGTKRIEERTAKVIRHMQGDQTAEVESVEKKTQ